MWMQFWTNHPANVRRYVIADDTAELKRKASSSTCHTSVTITWRRCCEPDVRRVPIDPRAHLRAAAPVTGTASCRKARRQASHDPLARGGCRCPAKTRTGKAGSSRARVVRRLAFEVSGYLGWPGQYLAVRDVRTGVEHPVRPAQLAREKWVEARVPCPPGEFVIVAADATPESWFGFREPVEIGWTTPLVERVIANARLMFVAALALMVLAVRWSGAVARESSAPAPYVPSP